MKLRGVAPASEIPPIFGNGFGFNLMVYSDVAEGETINFQYYDSASDAVFDLAEAIGFESDMIVGSLTGLVFTYMQSGGGDDGGDDTGDLVGIGFSFDWPVVVGPSGSEVANYADFANSGSVNALFKLMVLK